jgi:predicted metalloprotease with PDZ domain
MFWSSVLERTDELDYGEALETLGLRFTSAAASPTPKTPKAWIGTTTRADGGRLVVAEVRRSTPAHAAGLNVDDEIVGIDAFRVRAGEFETRLEQYAAGDTVEVLVARRDRLIRVPVKLGTEPSKAWRLAVDPGATAAQRASLSAWFSGEI